MWEPQREEEPPFGPARARTGPTAAEDQRRRRTSRPGGLGRDAPDAEVEMAPESKAQRTVNSLEVCQEDPEELWKRLEHGYRLAQSRQGLSEEEENAERVVRGRTASLWRLRSPSTSRP